MLTDHPPLEPLVDATRTDEPAGAAPLSPAGRGRRRLTAAFAAVALVGGAAGAATATALDRDDGQSRTARSPVSRPSSTVAGAGLDMAAVIAKAEPSVVTIRVELGGRASGAGTGVVIGGDGEILTNAHVVDGASSVRVTLAGESQSRAAAVVGADAGADLALLRVEGASGLPTAELGSSDDLQVGDDVVAIGNALGLRGNPTVTRGIVSGLDRSLDTEEGVLTGLIQTDASISSGNSGGPLVDAEGRVVGINTAVAASSGRTSAENVGFAIAIDRALPVIERLRSGSDEAAPAAVLGVRIGDPVDGSRGALVSSVDGGSAAEAAGIEAGDLIVAVDDRDVDGAPALTAAVRAHAPGDEVTIRLVRDGGERAVRVRLGG
ncbi:MAG TPA: trypsin-like peptidase domain-containing protein [Acidimicrobiales bacterium]|nr:trypsin-like peptidase domain-containing protein [Acidimicrobiales bacterium]